MCSLIVEGSCVVTYDEWWRLIQGVWLAGGVGVLIILLSGD